MESETSRKTGATSENKDDGAPASKRFRCQEPDVTVIVGDGDDKEQFDCYSIILCCASGVFDTMLTTQMKEKNSREIRLPDKKPSEWKLFYNNFIDPAPMADPDLPVGGGVLKDLRNVDTMLPWFDYFGMEKWVSKCDHLISSDLSQFSQTLQKLTATKSDKDKVSHSEVKEGLALIFRGLQRADRYGLPLTEETSFRHLRTIFGRIFRVVDEDLIKELRPFVQLDGFKTHIWANIKTLLPIEMQDEDPVILFGKDLFPSLLMARIEMEESKDLIFYLPTELSRDMQSRNSSLTPANMSSSLRRILRRRQTINKYIVFD